MIYIPFIGCPVKGVHIKMSASNFWPLEPYISAKSLSSITCPLVRFFSAEQADRLNMHSIFLVFYFIYFLVIYYDSFISFCLYIKEILLLLMILFNLKYYIITYISWARRGHCPQKYKKWSTRVLPIL